MKTYSNIYRNLCSLANLGYAYLKARRGKSKKFYVKYFEDNLRQELEKLKEELINHTYKPKPLKGFIIIDPKTRKIHSSTFRDRIVHHAIVNILEPIFEKIFIYDSFASRKNKGSHLAVNRFEQFMRKVSFNGKLVKNAINDNQIEGYCLKADIKSYFDNVDHEILLSIINKKCEDKNIILLVKQVLDNFDPKTKGKGMPLGNYTSQFFANVYLNELDYFVKHELKAKYYIRYVDDFVILHRNKKRLSYFKNKIDEFLRKKLKLWLHPQKSNILTLRNGITFLGYRIFYHNRLLIKRNIRMIKNKISMLNRGEITKKEFTDCFKGWLGYAKWANSYKLRKEMLKSINKISLLK